VLDREINSDFKKISTINLERDDMVTMANSMELRISGKEIPYSIDR